MPLFRTKPKPKPAEVEVLDTFEPDAAVEVDPRDYWGMC